MSIRVIISGGGTGGHIFPAIAMANEIKRREPNAEILFVGAADRMEMQKVPEAGYPIKGLWISGIQRKFSIANLSLPFKWIHSLLESRKIIKQFKPHVVVGVGGYASAAVLYVAAKMNIKTLIQEQNSFAGITNRFLASKVNAICVAYPNMERFFPKDKIKITGNPVRAQLLDCNLTQEEAKLKLGFNPEQKVVFITGGSLGARSLNKAVENSLNLWQTLPLQLLWQTGSVYYNTYKGFKSQSIQVLDFVLHMDWAYKAADLIVCRAGALTLSEITALGKAAILVPSPYVAEDHQTHNAQQLVHANAALMIPDQLLNDQLAKQVAELIQNPTDIRSLQQNASELAKPNATQHIVDHILELI